MNYFCLLIFVDNKTRTVVLYVNCDKLTTLLFCLVAIKPVLYLIKHIRKSLKWYLSKLIEENI